MTKPDPSSAAAFARHFGTPPALVAAAPGRVNLMGEHTDYNGGLVLPMALDGMGVEVALGHGPQPGVVEIWSETFATADSRALDDAPAGRWSDYALGCVQAALPEGARPGLRLALTTTLPIGAGLSSSAALEVAVLRGLDRMFGLNLSAHQIAVMARAVENDFVGMPCGIMDQFAASVGDPGQAIFLNTRTLAHEPAPALPGHRFVILDSGVHHQLTEDGYATRVAECREAAAALGVDWLSDLTHDDLPRIMALPDPLGRRARHIVTDNDRVRRGLAALRAGDAPGFGALMIASHASQRDDYAITVPETDRLVTAAVEAGALGARQTGGGFGGAIVALVATPAVDDWGARMTADFPGTRVLALA